jgi:hypothetical protein
MWMNMNATTGGGRWVLVGSSIGDDESKGLVLCNGGGS